MTEPCAKRASTRVSRIIKAGRKAVYQAFLDPDSVASWLAPDNMTGHVHTLRRARGWQIPNVADLPGTWAFAGQDVWGHGHFPGSRTRRLSKSLGLSRMMRHLPAR